MQENQQNNFILSFLILKLDQGVKTPVIEAPSTDETYFFDSSECSQEVGPAYLQSSPIAQLLTLLQDSQTTYCSNPVDKLR